MSLRVFPFCSPSKPANTFKNGAMNSPHMDYVGLVGSLPQVCTGNRAKIQTVFHKVIAIFPKVVLYRGQSGKTGPPLKTITSLNKEPRLLHSPVFWATVAFGDTGLKCSKCYDRKANKAFRTSTCCNRLGKKIRDNSKCYCRLGRTAYPPYLRRLGFSRS